MPSSGMLHHVARVRTDVSEKHIASTSRERLRSVFPLLLTAKVVPISPILATLLVINAIYRVSQMRSPNFECIKISAKCFSPGVNGILRPTAVIIPAQVFRVPHGPPLGLSSGSSATSSLILIKLNLVCCVPDICP
jgi:hypothetical protein